MVQVHTEQTPRTTASFHCKNAWVSKRDKCMLHKSFVATGTGITKFHSPCILVSSFQRTTDERPVFRGFTSGSASKPCDSHLLHFNCTSEVARRSTRLLPCARPRSSEGSSGMCDCVRSHLTTSLDIKLHILQFRTQVRTAFCKTGAEHTGTELGF